MSALTCLIANRIASGIVRRSIFYSTPVAYFASFQKYSKPKRAPTYNQTRLFFDKPIPRDAITPILFGGGVLAIALGIAWIFRRQEMKYADSSFHPVYEQ